MSSGSSVPWTYQQVFILDHLSVIALVIVYYDHLITFDSEYRHIWRKLRSPSSWLFLLNRYFAFFSTVTWIGSFVSWPTDRSCGRYSLYREVLTALIEFVVTSNMFLRVYALYGRDKRLLAVGITVFSTMIAICIWKFTGQLPDIVNNYGCHIILPDGNAIAIPWLALLGLDILIFGLTFFKTWSAFRAPGIDNSQSLMALMFRDGVMYYVMLTSANLANIITFYFLPPMLKGSFSAMAGSISTTMLSRMMLNLHERAAYEHTFAHTKGNNTVPPSTVDFFGYRIDNSSDDLDLNEFRDDLESDGTEIRTVLRSGFEETSNSSEAQEA